MPLPGNIKENDSSYHFTLKNCLPRGKKSTSSFTFSLRYCKYIINLFWILWACLASTPKVVHSICKKYLCLSSAGKKHELHPHVYLVILKRYTNSLSLTQCHFADNSYFAFRFVYQSHVKWLVLKRHFY